MRIAPQRFIRHLLCLAVPVFLGELPLRADIIPGGLILDLNADVGVTESAGSVSTWANQAPSGGDDVATNRGTPTVIAGPNGHSAIQLDEVGEKDRLAGDDNTAFDAIMQGSGHTWFAVVRPTVNANGGRKNAIFGTLTNGNPFSGIVAHVSDNDHPAYMLRPGSSDLFVDGTSSVNNGGWYIVAGRLSAGTGNQTAEIFTDGPTAEASSSTVNISPSTSSDELTIGAERVLGGENFVGDIARILIYERPLDEAELNEVGATLGLLYDIEDHGFSAGPGPEITAFSATPAVIASGSQATLAWTVNNPAAGALQLAISPGVGDVTGQTQIQVSPGVTTTYTLVAENINAGTSAQVTVTVDQPPTISSFTVSDSDIRAGESTTLSWNVSGAGSVSIDGGVGAVPTSGSAPVSPAATNTYTLTATNAVGSSTAQVTVDVDRSPLINDFTIDQPNVDPGTQVTLSWDVLNADTLTIDQGIGDVTGQANATDTPSSTRTYVLTAMNTHGTSTANVSVVVGETLTISEFLAVNSSGRPDEDGDTSDWIEVHNTTGSTINTDGWYLTDDANLLTKWRMPPFDLAAGDYLIVFASGKDRATAGAEMHTNFRLSGGGEYLALVRPDGTTITRHYSPTFPPQQSDISYGLSGTQLTEGHFDPPTPGSANGTAFDGFVADTAFSIDRGFYDAPIQVEITTATPDAEIRYRTDGTAPTESTGTLYTGPVAISSTTTLRAIAYKAGFRPTNVDTHTYIFTSDVKSQPDMDPEVVNDAAYSGTIDDDLKSLPALSLVLPDSSMFGGSGIYSNPSGRGIAWEREVSVEFFNLDKTEEFQVDAGIRIHGADARGHQKKPFKLYFRSDYGPGKLRYPLFPGDVEEFDKLVLRGGGHEGWTSPYGSGIDAQSHSATLLRDQFLRQTHGEMGNLSPRGRHAHMYINGRYWGVYVIHERADQEFGEAHLGGAEEDYDVMKTGGVAVDGSDSDWNAMVALANGGLSSDAAYAEMLTYIDMESFIDNMIVRIWSGDIDWLRSDNMINETGGRNKNWYALRRTRGAAPGKWQFFVWDGELSMGKGHRSNRNTHFNISDVDINDSPGRLYDRLRDNSEFRLRFADRLQKHFFNGGAMTAQSNQARWNALAEAISDAMVGESARWGDAVVGSPYTRDDEWQSEVDWMANTFMAGRTTTVLDQFAAIGLYPGVDPPTFLVGGSPQHGGAIGAQQISFQIPPSGVIYYTTDGTDPRTPSTSGAESILLDQFAPGASGLVPSTTNGGSTLTIAQWTNVAAPPNSASWISGTTGLGYETTVSTYDDLIDIDVQSMHTENGSAYLRVPFEIPDQATLDAIGTLTLHMKYDDGFIAYLNGVRVADANAQGASGWEALASGDHPDGAAVVFEPFNITAHADELQIGTNMLAIHALNNGTDSSDLLAMPRITYGSASSAGISPTAQMYSGPLTLPVSANVRARILDNGEWSALNEATFLVGELADASNTTVSEIMYNPLGTSEELEFIELENSSSGPVDFSLVKFDSGVDFTFPVGTAVPAGGSILVVADQVAFEANYGPGLPVAGVFQNGTSLDNNGETITLLAADNSIIESFRYDDSSSWPQSPDGQGPSLTRILLDPKNDPAMPTSWRPSVGPAGSPGATDAIGFSGDPGADLDNDGLSALLEHAFGTSDSDPTSPPFSLAMDPLTLTLQQNLAADDVTWTIEQSSDLIHWVPIDTFLQTTADNFDGTATVQFTSLAPPGTQQFWRARASLR